MDHPPPKRQFVRILWSLKIEYLLYKPPYLTGIEGPPPKRNVVSSSLAGGAKTTAVSRFSLVCSGFCFKQKAYSKGRVVIKFCCMLANWI